MLMAMSRLSRSSGLVSRGCQSQLCSRLNNQRPTRCVRSELATTSPLAGSRYTHVLAGSAKRRPSTGKGRAWKPSFNHLIVALVHQRSTEDSDAQACIALINLTDHPLEGISALAFAGLLRDDDLAITWVAAQLAMRMAIRRRSVWSPDSGHDHTTDQISREQSLQMALTFDIAQQPSQFPAVPKAWEQLTMHLEEGSEEVLRDPDPFFD